MKGTRLKMSSFLEDFGVLMYVIPHSSGLFFKCRMLKTTTDHVAEALQDFIPGQINLIWRSALRGKKMNLV